LEEGLERELFFSLSILFEYSFCCVKQKLTKIAHFSYRTYLMKIFVQKYKGRKKKMSLAALFSTVRRPRDTSVSTCHQTNGQFSDGSPMLRQLSLLSKMTAGQCEKYMLNVKQQIYSAS
jgi:hypothetical protein